MRRLPASSCGPSTFCVTSVKSGLSRSIKPRRQSYHSQESSGSQAKAAGGGQIFGAEAAPQPALASKRWHAALGADARAGERDDRPRRRDPSVRLLDQVFTATRRRRQ
jgi:hypothetical protein